MDWDHGLRPWSRKGARSWGGGRSGDCEFRGWGWGLAEISSPPRKHPCEAAGLGKELAPYRIGKHSSPGESWRVAFQGGFFFCISHYVFPIFEGFFLSFGDFFYKKSLAFFEKPPVLQNRGPPKTKTCPPLSFFNGAQNLWLYLFLKAYERKWPKNALR